MSGTAPTSVEHEWSILLASCGVLGESSREKRLQALLREPVRWAILLALADRHGVQPQLYQALHQARYVLPAEESKSLKQAYETNVHKALLLSRELLRIASHLAESDIAFMPYKGLALAECLYGDLAMRQTGDIDLLIRPEDLKRTQQALAQLAYVPHKTFSEVEERAYVGSGYECAFDSPAGRCSASSSIR